VCANKWPCMAQSNQSISCTPLTQPTCNTPQQTRPSIKASCVQMSLPIFVSLPCSGFQGSARHIRNSGHTCLFNNSSQPLCPCQQLPSLARPRRKSLMLIKLRCVLDMRFHVRHYLHMHNTLMEAHISLIPYTIHIMHNLNVHIGGRAQQRLVGRRCICHPVCVTGSLGHPG
jgi:hypothetical protein